MIHVVSIFDIIKLTFQPQTTMTYVASKFEIIKLTLQPQTTMTHVVSIFDTIKLTLQPQTTMTYDASIFEIIKLILQRQTTVIHVASIFDFFKLILQPITTMTHECGRQDFLLRTCQETATVYNRQPLCRHVCIEGRMFRLFWLCGALSQLIREARIWNGDLTLVWLDLANIYGSIPHHLMSISLKHYHVPDQIQKPVNRYFGDIRLCFFG